MRRRSLDEQSGLIIKIIQDGYIVFLAGTEMLAGAVMDDSGRPSEVDIVVWDTDIEARTDASGMSSCRRRPLARKLWSSWISTLGRSSPLG